MCVPGYGFWLRPAIPGWGSWCVCVGFDFSCSPLFLVWVLRRVGSCLRPVCFPPPLGGAALGMGLCGGCRGWGFSSPFLLFFGLRGGLWFSALSCRGFVVFAAACPGLGPRGLCSPFNFRLGCVCFFFASGPPLLRWGVRRRAFPPALRWSCGCGRPLLSAGCFWVRQGCPPAVRSGGPSGVAFGAAWPGGLPASCRVGARLRGCMTVSCPPPFFLQTGARSWLRGGSSPSVLFVCFWGGGLPVPPSAFPGLMQALVRIQCGLPGCCWCCYWLGCAPAQWVGYVHALPGGLSCLVRFWLCRLGGCARQFREVLG